MNLDKKVKFLYYFLVTIILICFVLLMMKYFPHTTSPKSIDLYINYENDYFSLNAKWKSGRDFYSLGTDFIAFYLPNNKEYKIEIVNDNLDSSNSVQKNNNTIEKLQDELKTIYKISEGTEIILIPISLKGQTSLNFKLIGGLKLAEVEVQYIHLINPPMGALEYWVKSINSDNNEIEYRILK
jgi:hypothetical protein